MLLRLLRLGRVLLCRRALLLFSPCKELLSLSLHLLFLGSQLHAHLLLRLSLFQRRICDLNLCVGVSAVLITIGASVVVSCP